MTMGVFSRMQRPSQMIARLKSVRRNHLWRPPLGGLLQVRLKPDSTCAGIFRAVALVLTLACAACSTTDERTAPQSNASNPPKAGRTAPQQQVQQRPRVVILGDSLTAGLGIAIDQSYPALIQKRLNDAGLNYEVVNAGVSGDTSAGGLSRLDWALEGDVRALVVALGGNDGLRGLPPEQLKRNLAQIIERAQSHHIDVVLAGMEAPPNYGRDYIVAFHKVYPALAKEYHVALVPFLLQGVAGSDTLNQPDGIHPTAAGARIVADNVWAVLRPVLEQKRRESGT
jgi:acyl-CoA thioesterase-1